MVDAYSAYEGDEQVKFLSHTVDPKHDTPQVLADYAAAHGAELPQWHFVTGDAVTTYKLARRGYLIDQGEDVAEEAFVHSQLIVLVDPNKVIRGFYDGTEEGDDERSVGCGIGSKNADPPIYRRFQSLRLAKRIPVGKNSSVLAFQVAVVCRCYPQNPQLHQLTDLEPICRKHRNQQTIVIKVRYQLIIDLGAGSGVEIC